MCLPRVNVAGAQNRSMSTVLKGKINTRMFAFDLHCFQSELTKTHGRTWRNLKRMEPFAYNVLTIRIKRLHIGMCPSVFRPLEVDYQENVLPSYPHGPTGIRSFYMVLFAMKCPWQLPRVVVLGVPECSAYKLRHQFF